MERESISKKEQAGDGLLIALSGGVIGIIGAIAESRILSNPNPDTDAVILSGGATLIGASLVVNGTVRYINTRRLSRNQKEQE